MGRRLGWLASLRQTPGLRALILAAVTLLVLGAAPSAIATSKPVTVPVRQALSVVKAPDGTITARLVLKAKDPACLSAIPWLPGFPVLWLSFPGDTRLPPFPHSFQMPVVGRAAYEVTLPPGRPLLWTSGTPPQGAANTNNSRRARRRGRRSSSGSSNSTTMWRAIGTERARSWGVSSALTKPWGASSGMSRSRWQRS